MCYTLRVGALSLVSKSSRPRRGRAADATNALKHGLRGAAAVVPGVESEADWNSHLAAVVADSAPQSYVEAELTRILAEALWRRRRLVAVESAALAVNVSEGGGPSAWWLQGAAAVFQDAKRRLDLLNLVEHETSDLPLIRNESPPKPGSFTDDDAQYVLAALLPSPSSMTECDSFKALVRKSWKTGAQLHALVHPSAWPLARRLQEAEIAQARAEGIQAEQRSQRVGAARLMPTEAQANVLLRYEGNFDRTISRCLAEIERLQRMRAGEAVPPPLKVTVSSES